MSSELQHRLHHFSEVPPVTAWKGIAAALDEMPAFAQKLYDFEKAPPARVWNSVAQHITTPEAKVISFRPKLFKYAIAAAVLALIATGTIFYLKNGAGSDLASQSPNTPGQPSKNTLLDSSPHPHTKTITAGTGTKVSGTNEGLKKSTFVPDQALVQFSPRVRLFKRRIAARPVTVRPEEKNIVDTESQNRYMIATTAAGNVVRLPKKAYSDYACADALKDYRCKERIATIQSKMAASVATDFTNFIDLLKKLQDNP